jgi:hypothetical protein
MISLVVEAGLHLAQAVPLVVEKGLDAMKMISLGVEKGFDLGQAVPLVVEKGGDAMKMISRVGVAGVHFAQ